MNPSDTHMILLILSNVFRYYLLKKLIHLVDIRWIWSALEHITIEQTPSMLLSSRDMTLILNEIIFWINYTERNTWMQSFSCGFHGYCPRTLNEHKWISCIFIIWCPCHILHSLYDRNNGTMWFSSKQWTHCSARECNIKIEQWHLYYACDCCNKISYLIMFLNELIEPQHVYSG
jgi:hypothetical protein